MASTAVITPTDTVTSSLGKLRLMQLVSPALPIGAFTYSQGLERAVEDGWVSQYNDVLDWLRGQMHDGQTYLDLPLFARLYQACAMRSLDRLQYWSDYQLASRETRELRQEDMNRARAMVILVKALGVKIPAGWDEALKRCQAAPFALAAHGWDIGLVDAASGLTWGWLENQVAAAVKLVPLGQTDGQRALLLLAQEIPGMLELGLEVADDEIGSAAPALAIASSRHEFQYTRLFRS